MKKQALAAALSATLAGCATAIDPIPQPTSGYDAIEFLRATQIQDHAFNIYTFSAGRRLTADRFDKNGRKLYCGLARINDDPKPFEGCFGFEAPSTIVIGPGAGFKEVRRPQPGGTIKQVKVKL